jgi:hypothetical protein
MVVSPARPPGDARLAHDARLCNVLQMQLRAGSKLLSAAGASH